MGLEASEPTGDISGIDADQLLSEIEGSNSHDIPMSTPPAAGGKDPAAQPVTPVPTSQDLEFDYNGKQVKVPFSDPKVKTWVQQGYDYSQKMETLKQDRQKWDQERGQLEKQFAPYRQVDEFAKQNPEWWAHVEAAWKNREANRAQGGSDENLPEWVKQKLNELDEIKPFLSELKQDRETQKIKAEDQELSSEIQSIREKYSNLDWKTLDESGQSLEARVLKYAVENKIPKFKTAFHDYYHDHLITLHEERGKEQITKDIQKRNKLGIIGESPTPRKGIQPAEGVKNKSYEDILREAKEELGVA